MAAGEAAFRTGPPPGLAAALQRHSTITRDAGGIRRDATASSLLVSPPRFAAIVLGGAMSHCSGMEHLPAIAGPRFRGARETRSCPSLTIAAVAAQAGNPPESRRQRSRGDALSAEHSVVVTSGRDPLPILPYVPLSHFYGK